MKMQHKNCGGTIVEHGEYDTEEFGIVPRYECLECKKEIVGDSQFELVPENLEDEIQIESFVSYPKIK